MQFIILREKLLEVLQLVIGAVEKRQTMPILSNILLKASSDNLLALATDLEIELQGRSELISLIEPGSITVPARKLLDICRALPENKQLTFVLEGEHLLINCERSRFKLVTLPADDFPNVEIGINTHEFSISQNQFRSLIEKVYFSSAQQDVRYYLNGIYLIKRSDFLTTVATDGHRLAVSSYFNDFPTESLNCIIPRKAIIELIRLLNNTEDTVSVNISDNHFSLAGTNYNFITKLIDGTFPDYTKVIPKNVSKSMLIDKDLFKKMLVRIAVLSNEKYHGVKLCFAEGKLIVESHNSNLEEAYEELLIEHNIDNFEIAFNVNYLLDAINALPSGNIYLSMSNNQSGILIKPEKDDTMLYVIMPMRI